ncbi:hypothetical protein B7463_g7198, partial [Scytalidium lignicola]
MAPASSEFLRLWRDHQIKTALISHMDTDVLCALRLTSSACCDAITQPLFSRTFLTFTPSALTRPSRLEGLARIGHLIEHLTFSMPHADSTFLPPLLNPITGQEIAFLYTPHTSCASVIQRPKYGCPALGDILTQQYPPIFHAATNVSAFINLMTKLPNLRHLTISCPDQDPAQRYRRDAVDYALISLRIAIERAPVTKLDKLSLRHIHPSGLLYFRHMPGFGCTPVAGRRWKQIKKLYITMDSWDFYGTRPGLDHLKILEDYIRSFSSTLEKVSFGWNGRRGPCPLTLFSDPLFATPKNRAKLFNEVTSPMSPLPTTPRKPAMRFPNLRYMQVRNATMSMEQVSEFILDHRDTVHEFDFENVPLINGGTWEEALAPLTRMSGDEWSSRHSASEGESYASSPKQTYLDQFEQFKPPVETLSDPDRMSVSVTKLKKKKGHRRRKRKHTHMRNNFPEISNPIHIIESTVQLLQPTTFNPNVQGVQRNLAQDAAQQKLADDPAQRVSTLKKAKEAVLTKLSREYSKGHEKKGPVAGFFRNAYPSGMSGRGFLRMESNTALVPLMFSHS